MNQLHPDLQVVLKDAINIVDFSLICGCRNKEEQNAAYDMCKSDKRYPDSKHNKQPSEAVDIIPFPFSNSLDWTDLPRFAFIMGVMKAIAYTENIFIRFGFDWDGDTNWQEHKLQDWPHIELL